MSIVKILSIDDNHYNQRLMRKMLEIKGYSVALAQNATRGFALIKEIKPDLILLDIGLPDVSGFDLLRILKSDAATANIPAIAVTAYCMHGDREKCLKVGFAHYIAKPIMRQELYKAIEITLGISHSLHH